MRCNAKSFGRRKTLNIFFPCMHHQFPAFHIFCTKQEPGCASRRMSAGCVYLIISQGRPRSTGGAVLSSTTQHLLSSVDQ
jgi:hypothetical protein